MLEKGFVRDGNRNIIGSVTSGYSDTSCHVGIEPKARADISAVWRTVSVKGL